MGDNNKRLSRDPDDYFKADHLKYGLRTRALRGATLSTIGQVSSFGIQTISTIILARILTPDDFGLVAMVVVISLFLSNLTTNAFNDSIIQMKEINHEQVSTLFWINVGTSILLALLLVASSSVIVWFYKEPRLRSIVYFIAISNVIGGLSVQHQAILKRNIQFLKISANDVMSAIFSSIISISLALWGWGYWALVAKYLTAPLLISIGAWVMCGWRPSLPAKGVGVRPILTFGFHTSGVSVLQSIRKNMDKVLLGRFFGSQTLGYYERAFHLSNMIPNQVIFPLYSVAISTFSKLSDDPEKYRNNFLNVVSMLAFVGMPLSAALTLISHDVILLLLGPQWEKAGQIFLAFGMSIGVIIIWNTHGWLHLSLGRPDRWFRWSFVDLIVTVLCVIIGLRYGTLGVAVALSASYYIMVGPALWYAGVPIHLSILSILSKVWRFFVSAFSSGIFCWFILYYFDLTSKYFYELNIFIRIIISTGLCISLYLIVIVILYRGIMPISQLLSIIREIVSRKSMSK